MTRRATVFSTLFLAFVFTSPDERPFWGGV